MKQKEIKPLLFRSETEAYLFGKQFEETKYQTPLTSKDLCTLAMGARGVNYIDVNGEKQVLLPQNLDDFDSIFNEIQQKRDATNQFRKETLVAKSLGTKSLDLDLEDNKRLDEAIKKETGILSGPLKSKVMLLKKDGERPLEYLQAWQDTAKFLVSELTSQKDYISKQNSGSNLASGSEPETPERMAWKEAVESMQEEMRAEQAAEQNKNEARSDAVHAGVEITAGFLMVIGAVVAGIVLTPVLGPLAWVVGGFMGVLGGAMIYDGLRDDRDHDRAESLPSQDGPSHFRDVSEPRVETPKAPVASFVSSEASAEVDNQVEKKEVNRPR